MQNPLNTVRGTLTAGVIITIILVGLTQLWQL